MANSVPTLTGLTTPVTFLENGAPQIIDADVTFTDADNNFDTGTLTVAHLLAEDTVAIHNQGTGAGQIGVAGSNVHLRRHSHRQLCWRRGQHADRHLQRGGDGGRDRGAD